LSSAWPADQAPNRISSHPRAHCSKIPPSIYERSWCSSQTGRATGAGEHAGGRYAVPAGRAEEPVAAIFALRFGNPLFFLTLGAHAIHFFLFDVVREDQGTTGAFLRLAIANLSTTIRIGAQKDRFAAAAPIFSLFHFLTYGALIHDQPLDFRVAAEPIAGNLRKKSRSLKTGLWWSLSSWG